MTNARRVVACVNACAGILTEMLEDVRCRPHPRIEMATMLRKQRDDLLAALEELVELCTPSFCECDPEVGYQCRACHPSSSIKAAKAAIASAKGGAV